MFGTDKKVQQSPSRHLFFSHQKSQRASLDCEYCLKKQKLSNGDETQRCLMHSIKQPQSLSSSRSQSSNIIDELMDLLADVEDILQDYWVNLHQYSQGSPQKVKDQMTPVFAAVSRIEQKLSRFPFGDTFQSPSRQQIKRPFEEQRKETRSQKLISTNYAQLFEDTTVNDQIKEWVIYFHKIMVNRQVRDQLLPFDDQIDMKIFKESMQRKFVTFAKNFSKYQAKLSLALQKLLFYMEACGPNVDDKVLQTDIKFIQTSELPKYTPSQNEYSLLFMQALTIQDLLAKTQY